MDKHSKQAPWTIKLMRFSAFASHMYFVARYSGSEKIFGLVNSRSKRREGLKFQLYRCSHMWAKLSEDSPKEVSFLRISRLPQLDKSCKIIYAIDVCIQIVLFCKYAIICVLDTSILSGHSWIDCYILGRWTINSRLSRANSWFALMLASFHLAWRLRMFIFTPSFNMECVEFMLYNHGEIFLNEIRSNQSISGLEQQLPPAEGAISAFEAQRRQARGGAISAENLLDASGGGISVYDSVLYLRNPFAKEMQTKFFLKPNRTSKSWKLLSRCTMVYYGIAASALSIILPLAVSMLVPMMLTKRGFFFSYPKCCAWIESQPNRSDWAYIYPENISPSDRQEKSFLPFNNLVHFNLYHLTRILFDAFDSTIIFTLTTSAITVNTYIAFILAIDCFSYSRSVIEQLRNLIKPTMMIGSNHNKTRSVIGCSNYHEIYRRMIETQAVVVEYFNTIANYNSFASDYTLLCICMWALFTAVSTYFLVGHNASSGQVELWAIQVVAISILIVTIGSFAIIKATSRQIHSLIATLMSSDNFEPGVRIRWSNILGYYSPSPLHCFAMFRSVEISWLFGIKLIGWLYSAFLVISNLFSVHIPLGNMQGG